MTATISITGDKQTIRRLGELDKRTRKRVVPKAVRAGGAVILKAARNAAPAKNRRLKRTMIQVLRRKEFEVAGFIGQDRSKARKAVGKGKRVIAGGISGAGNAVPIHLVDQKVKPHDISGSPLVFRIAGQTIFTGSVKHPGMPGQHFMRKAADASRTQAQAALFAKMNQEIDKEVVKLRSGA